MSERDSGYQYEFYNKEYSEWEMSHWIYETKDEAKQEAIEYGKENDTKVRTLFFNGDDWDYIWAPDLNIDEEKSNE